MRRRLMPPILIFLLLMLDTAILPVFFTSVYMFPFTLALIICIGASYGRMHGMLYGMIAGLLMDILVGYPLGMRTFQYIATGFLSGLIVHVTDEERLKHGFRPVTYAVRLALFSAGCLLVCEVALGVYQYFNTARFISIHALNALIRIAIGTALTMLLYMPFTRIMFGKRKRSVSTARSKREVRFF